LICLKVLVLNFSFAIVGMVFGMNKKRETEVSLNWDCPVLRTITPPPSLI